MERIVVAVILGILLIGVVAYLFLRKKPADEAPRVETTPKKPALDEKKPPQKAPAEKAEPKPRETKAEAPPPSEEPPPTKAETPATKAEAPARPAPSVPPPKSTKDLSGLKKGLTATRKGFMARIADLFTGKKEIDPSIVGELEEIMLTSDVGPATTQAILGRLKEKLEKKELKDSDAVWAALKREAREILEGPAASPGLSLKHSPSVILMVGVNGVGKTTTIGKLATRLTGDGKKVMLAAGDTFRAAAVQQLEVWGKRVSAEVVKGKEGADPGSVAFEATTKAKEAGVDVLLIDTAGRLHTKVNLMDEIKKVRKTIGKAYEGAPHETLLVLDATTGQNAMNQAALFKDALDLTGIILTKLDGTAKGGIVLAISDELKVPVRYIGLGERAEDLREFDAADFVEALFSRESDEASTS